MNESTTNQGTHMERLSMDVRRYLVLQHEHDEEKAKSERIEKVEIPLAEAALARAEVDIQEANGAARRALDTDTRNRANSAVIAAENAFKEARAELESLENRKGNFKLWVARNGKELQEAERDIWATKRAQLFGALQLPADVLEAIEKIAAVDYALNGRATSMYGDVITQKYNRVDFGKMSAFSKQLMTEMIEQNT